METITTPAAVLALGSLALLSLADLRDRALPGIWIFFVAAALFGMMTKPWKVLAISLVLGWGGWTRFPLYLITPALFYPAAWPVILTAAGTRGKLIAGGDLLAIGGIACLLDGYAPLLALLGVLFWRRFWGKGQAEAVPAMPGMLLGVVSAIGWGIFS